MELKVTRYAIDSAGVATVWLHRPERRNSWTGRMHAEYRWIMKQLDSDPHVRVIVLTGSGSSFCVGADSRVRPVLDSPAHCRFEPRGGYPAERARPAG